ncbi:hypothetical protein [Paenibacillus thalictri]|uniref:Uncharacterized protein n=1 Tax=Paenibacillus thalictri TaxID=2527873 RepID=A0A4Q9DUD1_9BACL|nr:hypothetical protein [Paenibacillus thalictri]TBL80587.1 hypothetical protein EYB31_04990 [Paenibacillus thalictri]
MYTSDKPAISGKLIAWFWFLFFPVAVLLTLIRVIKHVNLSYHRILDYKLISKTCLLLFLFFTLAYMYKRASVLGDGDGRDFYYGCVAVLGIPGFLLGIISWVKTIQLEARYKKYYDLIYYQEVTSVQDIAKAVNKRESIVRNDLLRMIELRMIEDMSFDADFRHLAPSHWGIHESDGSFTINFELTGAGLEDLDFDEAPARMSKKVKRAPKTVECSGCGAKSVLQRGEKKNCDYCDSVLTYPR